MGLPILVRWHLYIESAPKTSSLAPRQSSDCPSTSEWSNPKEYGQMDHINPLTTETRTTRTPSFWGYPPQPHDYPYHWVILDPKSKEDEVKVANLKFQNGHYTRHTFWSCLIRCANMKWIRWVLLKIQSGHCSVHRRTAGQGDTSIPPFQLRWIGGYKYNHNKTKHSKIICIFDGMYSNKTGLCIMC